MQPHSIKFKKICPTNSKQFQKIFGIGFSIILFGIIVIIIMSPEKYMSSTKFGLMLFFNSVLPGLLPFLFFSKLLLSFNMINIITSKFEKPFNKMFNAPSCSSYVFLISILCGYPIGAKVLSDIKNNNQIDNISCDRIIPFCSSSGPLFIIGTVGFAMFNSKLFGIGIFIVHILTIFISAFILNFFMPKIDKNQPYLSKNWHINNKNTMEDLTYSTIFSTLLVGLFVTIFFLLIDIIIDFNILFPLQFILENILHPFDISELQISSFCFGLIEMTRGIYELSKTGINLFSFIIANAIISFSGMSIIIQSVTFFSAAKIKTRRLIITKVVQMIVSMLIAPIIFFILF